MAKLKRFGFLSLVTLLTMGLSGAGVYLSMGIIDSAKSQGENVDYELPIIDDNNLVEETPFSKTINSLINAKEIYQGNISIGLNPKNGNDVVLNVKDLNVDLSQMNTSVVNVATKLQVLYGGLDQTLSLRVENDEACYVEFDQNKFLFNIPQNLSDVMNILRAAGILVPNAAKGTEELNISELLSTAQSYLDKLSVSNETIIDNESYFTISMEDLEIKNTKISNIELILKADKNSYALTGIQTPNDKKISISTRKDETSPFEEILSLSLNGSLSLRQASSYKVLEGKELASYKDVTDGNSALLSTISDIIGNGSNIDIDVSYDQERKVKSPSITQEDDGYRVESRKHFDVDGLIQANIKDGNFSNGSYALTLNHLSGAEDGKDPEVLNDVFVAHVGSNTYLKFNDLVKAKVSNTTLKDMFSLISEGSGKKAIEVIASQMDATLGAIDVKALTNGDLTIVNGLINSEDTYFDYDVTTHSFILSIDGEKLGLTSSPITLEVKCNTTATEASKNGIEYIKITGLNFESYDASKEEKTNSVVSVTLTPKVLTEIAPIDAKEYSDFKGVVPLFEQVCDIASKKQFLANYSLTFNDKINDGTTNHFNTIYASGSIGADLSKVATAKLLDGTKDGTYYLSMNATTAESSYQHNLDFTYQNHNLYFGFDSLVKDSVTDDSLHDVRVFKNYIEQAQIGQIKEILDAKTDSHVSDSLLDVGKILELLNVNETFNNDIEKIKKGSLKGLDSFLSIKADDSSDNLTNTIELTIDTAKIFKADSLLGKNVGKIVLHLDSSILETGKLQFKEIEIGTVISSDQDFSFKLSFKDYVDPTLKDVSSYVKILDTQIFTKAFYNLGNNLKKYGVKVDAQYKKDPNLDEEGKGNGTYGLNVGITGSAYWDFTNEEDVKFSGGLTLTHPYVSLDGLQLQNTSANQTISFGYQQVEVEKNGVRVKDGEFTADYNQHMHIMMHSSTVSDIVKVVSNKSETNLLNNLLSQASNISTSMPIMDVITKRAPSLLLDYPYIHKVEFNDEENYIELSVDQKLFNLEDKGNLVKVRITYDEGSENSDPTITSISIDLSKDNEIIKATLSLVQYDENSLPNLYEYTNETKDQFVNLDGLSNLTKMAIDTTEFNYFHTVGYLNVNLTLFAQETQTPINLEAFCFDLNIDVSIYLYDNEVYCYLRLEVGDHELTDAGYYITEYAFKEGKVYINNTKTVAIINEDEEVSNQISSTAYRVTKEEFKKNILHYLVAVGLDLDSRPAGKTIMANIYHALDEKENDNEEETTTSSLTGLTEDLHVNLSSDFSRLFTKGAIYDENKKKFTFSLLLNNLLSVVVGKDDESISLVDFGDTYLKLYHQSKTLEDGTSFTPFYAMQLGSNVSVLDGLAKLSIRGQFISNANQGDLLYLNDSTEDKEVLEGKMSRFFSLTQYVDENMDVDYQIDRFQLKKKKVYSFTKLELSEFINDYDVEDNGKKLSYSLNSSDENFALKLSSMDSFLIFVK